ncbi:hypothetical protein MNBD_CHLOROFLEXI01-1362 [hydrothermal vent metagenome]|uniref:STAS/SEC14 domain-containing protein n=1 Tax=hydrothermal vent metagenome TaxID=652676 RepID=A0A3B0VDC6_9ZZZZ
MTVVQVEVSPNALLKAVEEMGLDDLNTFVDAMLLMRARRIAPSISTDEAELLDHINKTVLSIPEKERMQELSAKLAQENISEEEREELITLTDKSESLNVERLTAVSQLATLRQQPFRDVMKELGLLNPRF